MHFTVVNLVLLVTPSEVTEIFIRFSWSQTTNRQIP